MICKLPVDMPEGDTSSTVLSELQLHYISMVHIHLVQNQVGELKINTFDLLHSKFVQNLPIIVGEMLQSFCFKPSFNHYYVLIEQHFTVFIIKLLYLDTSQPNDHYLSLTENTQLNAACWFPCLLIMIQLQWLNCNLFLTSTYLSSIHNYQLRIFSCIFTGHAIHNFWLSPSFTKHYCGKSVKAHIIPNLWQKTLRNYCIWKILLMISSKHFA